MSNQKMTKSDIFSQMPYNVTAGVSHPNVPATVKKGGIRAVRALKLGAANKRRK